MSSKLPSQPVHGVLGGHVRPGLVLIASDGVDRFLQELYPDVTSLFRCLVTTPQGLVLTGGGGGYNEGLASDPAKVARWHSNPWY